MPFDVRMPDGTIIKNVPDGTTKEDILERYAASQQQPAVAQQPAQEPITFGEIGGGAATGRPVRGARAQVKPVTPLEATATGVFKGVINPALAATQVIGGEGGRQFVQQREQEYQQTRKEAGLEGFDVAQLAGAVVNPINRVLPGGAITGATAGAVLNPVTGRDLSFEEVLRGKAEQAATGAIFGAAAKTVLPALREGAQKILSSGGDLSPGQAFGGVGGFVMRSGEDILNTFKKFAGKETSSEKLNNAFTYVALNEALAPIGKTIPKAREDGFAMVSKGRKLASEAYEQAFNKIGKVAPDEDLFTSIRTVVDDARNVLDPNDFKKFEQELRKNVINRFEAVPTNRLGQGQPFEIDGQGLHNIKRYLQARLENLSNATDELGMARKGLYEQVMDGFKQYTYRVDPTGGIKAADTAWMNMYRIADAAKKAATNSGNFSPEQLMRSATTQTSTLVGGAGKGPLQQYANEALRIIGKDTSENLTPSDLKNIGVATGLGYTGFFNPVVLAAATAVGLTAEALGKLALIKPELYMKFREEALRQAGRGGMAITQPGQEEE